MNFHATEYCLSVNMDLFCCCGWDENALDICGMEEVHRDRPFEEWDTGQKCRGTLIFNPGFTLVSSASVLPAGDNVSKPYVRIQTLKRRKSEKNLETNSQNGTLLQAILESDGFVSDVSGFFRACMVRLYSSVPYCETRIWLMCLAKFFPIITIKVDS